MPVEEHDPFEDKFTKALHDAGNTFETRRPDLVARGEARGRRSTSRRRIAIAGSVTAVALTGALVLPGSHGDGVRQQSAAAGMAKPAVPPAPHTTVTRDELIDTLKKLLPKGKFSQEEGRGTDDRLTPYAQVVYDDGNGKAAIGVSLQRLLPGDRMGREATECPDKVFVAYDTCSSVTLSDGSALMVLQGYEYPNRRSGTKLWSADLVTPTGQHVSVQEWNSPAEKGEPVSREQPPLSTTQLKALVSARAWRDAVNAMAVPRGKAEPRPEQGVTGRPVSSTLASLLPKGLKVVARSGKNEGFGYVVLDDGKGESFVQANVQFIKDTDPDQRIIKDQLFGADARTLPDGTKVVWHQGPGDKNVKGGVMWTVDTIRPDGRRVVISAFNSGTQNTPPTRKAPALTMKQMETIATSTKWRQPLG
ncbi:hypothetical protein [Streptomyces colonosanans]|uniref:Uncharacterized protein n=1 Tax=Streptomyces colonosanans TaxID=1428652 RepID=A0A1S2NW08_9ACTN|nr:hypothetical protein [Streptomyces colonosanans]OIJ85405.1 hypothetical protein BIV24_28430 [Streptomyces colonosanans]